MGYLIIPHIYPAGITTPEIIPSCVQHIRRHSKEHLLIIININLSLFPLASGNLALEHDVNLAVRSTLHLGKEEVCSDETGETGTAPDVTTLATDCGRLSVICSRARFGGG